MRALNVHSLVDKLNLLCNNLASSYDVNKGGCCFIAYVIAQRLERLGMKYRLIVYSNDRKNYMEISHEAFSMVKNFRKEDSSITGDNTCRHYALYLEGGGVINPGESDHIYYIRGLSATNIGWLYRVGHWNTEYNIHSNRRIRKIINSFFNEYSK